MEISLPVLENPVEISLEKFDLDNYILGYTGTTKLNRLLFIAECCSTLQEQANTQSVFLFLLRSQLIINNPYFPLLFSFFNASCP